MLDTRNAHDKMYNIDFIPTIVIQCILHCRGIARAKGELLGEASSSLSRLLRSSPGLRDLLLPSVALVTVS